MTSSSGPGISAPDLFGPSQIVKQQKLPLPPKAGSLSRLAQKIAQPRVPKGFGA